LVDRIGWRTCAVVADVLRCLAFIIVMTAGSLPVMIAGALVVGLGSALFGPAALAGLPRLVERERARGAVMGLYGAIDDVALPASPAGGVACVGVANVGEVVLAREVLGVGGSGLAGMVAAAGLGTVAGSLCTRFTTAGAWAWRRAYVLGIAALMVDLFICAVL